MSMSFVLCVGGRNQSIYILKCDFRINGVKESGIRTNRKLSFNVLPSIL